jgi:hypothetical protein
MQSMSIGYLVDEENPMIWRGPMVTQALEQMLRSNIFRPFLASNSAMSCGVVTITEPLTGIFCDNVSNKFKKNLHNI